MTLLEVTKMAINQENTKTELEALSDRIDVMFMIGGKFEMDEYIELVGLISEKISLFEEMEASKNEETSGETEPETPPEDTESTENTDSSETANEEG